MLGRAHDLEPLAAHRARRSSAAACRARAAGPRRARRGRPASAPSSPARPAARISRASHGAASTSDVDGDRPGARPRRTPGRDGRRPRSSGGVQRARPCCGAQRLDHRRPEGQVGHDVVVHHVDVHPVRRSRSAPPRRPAARSRPTGSRVIWMPTGVSVGRAECEPGVSGDPAAREADPLRSSHCSPPLSVATAGCAGGGADEPRPVTASSSGPDEPAVARPRAVLAGAAHRARAVDAAHGGRTSAAPGGVGPRRRDGCHADRPRRRALRGGVGGPRRRCRPRRRDRLGAPLRWPVGRPAGRGRRRRADRADNPRDRSCRAPITSRPATRGPASCCGRTTSRSRPGSRARSSPRPAPASRTR